MNTSLTCGEAVRDTNTALSERPLLLDLFCGGGGAAMGYHRAGFAVLGVDLAPQPHYPFEFVQADALEFLARMGTYGVAGVHASPPCQLHSALLKGKHSARAKHVDLIGPVREALKSTGLPYVIENVPGAPLHSPIVLCGSMFGLGALDDDGNFRQLRRHRLFETSFPLAPPSLCAHSGRSVGVYGHGRWDNKGSKHRGGYQGNARECREAMGIDWCNRDGVVQAIPPAYSQHVGSFLLAHLQLRGELAAA